MKGLMLKILGHLFYWIGIPILVFIGTTIVVTIFVSVFCLIVDLAFKLVLFFPTEAWDKDGRIAYAIVNMIIVITTYIFMFLAVFCEDYEPGKIFIED